MFMNFRAITVLFWGFLIATAAIDSNSNDAHADARANPEIPIAETRIVSEEPC